MSLFDHAAKSQLISGMYNVDLTYSGTAYRPPIIRYSENTKSLPTGYIVVSFIRSAVKYGSSFDGGWIKSRPNSRYSEYAYGQSENVVIRSFCRDIGHLKGAILSEYWLRKLEEYIKINSNNIISGSSISRGSFAAYKDVSMYNTVQYYGTETSFEVVSTNYYTDEPSSGAESPVNISGIYISQLGVSGGTPHNGPNIWITDI